jgi:hypothetical protein
VVTSIPPETDLVSWPTAPARPVPVASLTPAPDALLVVDEEDFFPSLSVSSSDVVWAPPRVSFPSPALAENVLELLEEDVLPSGLMLVVPSLEVIAALERSAEPLVPLVTLRDDPRSRSLKVVVVEVPPDKPLSESIPHLLVFSTIPAGPEDPVVFAEP